MPQIMPMRGLRYTEKAGDLSALLAPPYDVISPEQRASIAARSPYNAVHIELADGGEERYEKVARMLQDWLAEGVLQRDEGPMYYVYQQVFEEAGVQHTRTALMAGVDANPWETGSVKPHEFTMSGPKEDRLRLLQSTGTQISPIFMIARDRAGQLAAFFNETMQSRPPDCEGTMPEGETHRFWAVPVSRYEAHQLAPLLSESFYIADGHHRYETAVNYKRWLLEQEGELAPDHPARFTMTAIVPASDPGLVIRPIHRLVDQPVPADWREQLEQIFDIAPFEGGDDPAACDAALAAEPSLMLGAGFDPDGLVTLRLRDEAAYSAQVPAGHSQRWNHLVVHLCRYGILQPLWNIRDAELTAGVVEYTHDTQEALAAVRSSAKTAAILVPPVQLDDILALSDEGERMPQKSTFFYPKMGTGMVYYPLHE